MVDAASELRGAAEELTECVRQSEKAPITTVLTALENAANNLILVPPKLNKVLGNKSFNKKKVELKKAKVPLDESLVNATAWGETEVAARTLALARLAYEKIFRV